MAKLGGWTKPTLICIVPVTLVIMRERKVDWEVKHSILCSKEFKDGGDLRECVPAKGPGRQLETTCDLRLCKEDEPQKKLRNGHGLLTSLQEVLNYKGTAAFNGVGHAAWMGLESWTATCDCHNLQILH
jgi:hypothetical protein